MSDAQQILNLRAGYTYISSFKLFYDMLKLSYSFYNIIYQAFGHWDMNKNIFVKKMMIFRFQGIRNLGFRLVV